MKYAAVVVLYNPNKKDIENINSYINYLDQLYVVDNSENEHDYANKIRAVDKCTYISKLKNLGIAGALNLGAQKAIEAEYQWLLTLDQDTKLNIQVFEEVSEYINNNDCSKIGIVTPWHNTKLLDEKPTEMMDHPLDVMTSGNFVNLDIYKKIGGFKEWLFIDGVDIEYCLNLRKNNYLITRLNSVSIDHDLGAIEIRKLLGTKYMCTNHNYLRNYYMQRNYRYIKAMYHDVDPDFCDTLVKIKKIIFKIIMFENDKYRKVRNIFRGIKDYHKGIKGPYRFNN